MTTKEKIRMLMKMKDDMSVYELSQETKIEFGDIAERLKKQNRELTKEQLEKIANYFCVKYEWLASDEE